MSKSAENKIPSLKVNIAKLKHQFKSDNPYLNDLVYAGVSQFLGVRNLENSSVTNTIPLSMLQFLQDLEILVPEGKEEEIALHS